MNEIGGLILAAVSGALLASGDVLTGVIGIIFSILFLRNFFTKEEHNGSPID